ATSRSDPPTPAATIHFLSHVDVASANPPPVLIQPGPRAFAAIPETLFAAAAAAETRPVVEQRLGRARGMPVAPSHPHADRPAFRRRPHPTYRTARRVSAFDPARRAPRPPQTTRRGGRMRLRQRPPDGGHAGFLAAVRQACRVRGNSRCGVDVRCFEAA
ncbi:hypothetical protein DFH09DRAFT_1393143, partial [Mycena vulgaris]